MSPGPAAYEELKRSPDPLTVAGRRGGNKRWEEMDKGEEGEKIGKERNEREREREGSCAHS